MSRSIDLAQLVTDHIASGAYSQPLTVRRAYVPEYDSGTEDDIKVFVVPSATELEQINRAEISYDITIFVGVYRRVETSTQAADVDAMIELTEEIVTKLRRAETFGEASVSATSIDPLFDAIVLREQSVFVSAIELRLSGSLLNP